MLFLGLKETQPEQLLSGEYDPVIFRGFEFKMKLFALKKGHTPNPSPRGEYDPVINTVFRTQRNTPLTPITPVVI